METSGGAGVGAVSPLPGPNTTTSTIDEAADHEASHPPVTFLAPAHSTDPLTCGSSTRNGAEHGAGTHGSADSTSPDRYQVQFVEIGTRKLGMVVENCSDVNVVVDLHHDNDGMYRKYVFNRGVSWLSSGPSERTCLKTRTLSADTHHESTRSVR